jgi:hypothetical protein
LGHVRPAGPAGRLCAVGQRQGRDPGRVSEALPGRWPALRRRSLGVGRDWLDRDRPRPLAGCPGARRRERLRLLRRPDAVLHQPLPGRIRANETNTSTWGTYGVDGNGDGWKNAYDPRDAIPAAARYLAASSAPGDYRAAIFAYNHADWYVTDVLAKAAVYRGAPRGCGPELTVDPALLREILGNPRIVLTPIQRADLRAGGIDPRLISTLAWIGRHHSVVITALRADLHPGNEP